MRKDYNILIIHAHWNNRGDEAALRAMLDALIDRYPSSKIVVWLLADNVEQFPYDRNIFCENLAYPRKRDFYFDLPLLILSNGKIAFSKRSKTFKKLVIEADIVIHGPGGPSIGDIYRGNEMPYILRLLAVNAIGTPYAFYAPSMGPFDKRNNMLRNYLRKKVINNSAVFCLREPISAEYVNRLQSSKLKEPIVTLDSAFQYPIDTDINEKKLQADEDLSNFIRMNKKIVGITVTDLMWNPKYSDDIALKDRINTAFRKMIEYLLKQGYGILFIPQLFGTQNDRNYMTSFSKEGCFTMSDEQDCYFQQYVISKMYALIGMRYHSNIFSAKMGCPFVSVAYEQKMKGFMKKINMLDYCVTIDNLSFETLKMAFQNLEDNYEKYKGTLFEESMKLQQESAKTTEIIIDFLENIKA